MTTVFNPTNGLTLKQTTLIGVDLLTLWSLMIVVSLKYVTLIMCANNHGEGGIMALLALAVSSGVRRPRMSHGLMIAGVFGAAIEGLEWGANASRTTLERGPPVGNFTFSKVKKSLSTILVAWQRLLRRWETTACPVDFERPVRPTVEDARHGSDEH